MILIGLAMYLGPTGCGYVSFARPLTTDEMALKAEVKNFYNRLQSAFAVGNPDAVASLFSPGIITPITKSEIDSRTRKFFAEHGTAALHIDGLSIDELSYVRAVVTISYRVETPGKTGGFQARQRQTLEHRRGRWYISSWETLLGSPPILP